ncbi:MAG: hypothetical protein BGO07_03800 [Alphaproteobacteria bacterium 40-19]|nr:MAG: hypothetical protein BGO07_03800 [Alphaproteobacteria bacterium 40-19]
MKKKYIPLVGGIFLSLMILGFFNSAHLPIFFLMGFGLLVLNGFLVYKIFSYHRQSQRNPFRLKVISVFASFVIVPCLIMALFSLIFLELGLQAWFHDRVRTALDRARSVAQGYLKEHTKVLEYTTESVVTSLNIFSAELAASQVPHSSDDFFSLYKDRVQYFLSFFEKIAQSEIVIFKEVPHLTSKGWIFRVNKEVLARSQLAAPLLFRLDLLTQEQLKTARMKGACFFSEPTDGRTFAVVSLEFSDPEHFRNTYLLMAKDIDKTVIDGITHANEAIDAYQNLFFQQRKFTTQFIILFILFSICLLLTAIYGGFRFSEGLTVPISRLLNAAQAIRQGRLEQVDQKGLTSFQELTSLIRTFNAMVMEMSLKEQRLTITNQHLKERHQFIKNVLAGVSSGVLSLNKQGQILLFNNKAESLLPLKSPQTTLTALFPQCQPLFEKALAQPERAHEAQLTLSHGGHPRIFYFYATASADLDSVIVTFDDITNLILAQKKAVWQDVARRVAHEVKNPLTPIVLSAQRLKRRYLPLIQKDPQTFEECIETIIQQVEYIGQLISEFSSFARMPNPVFHPSAVMKMIQRMITFQKEAYPWVTFELHTHNMSAQTLWKCDEGQLEQVFSNVIKNAVEAITEKKDQSQDSYRGIITFSIIKQASSLQIFIKDNGIGLPQDPLLFLWDPYVTTKERGTGLGLAIVQKIIYDHEGKIQLSQENEYTCVHIELPEL